MPRVSRRSRNSGSAKASRAASGSSGSPSLEWACSVAHASASRRSWMLRLEGMAPFCCNPGHFSAILALKELEGTELDRSIYHVLLEGRTVGPYDRRTIVGMRIKKALASDHVLIGADGDRLTVADLIHRRSPAPF